jgi:hypothetical protein
MFKKTMTIKRNGKPKKVPYHEFSGIIWDFCPHCSPGFCQGVMKKETRIENLKLALTENVWNKEERAQFKKELVELMCSEEEIARLDKEFEDLQR